jgi:hypothetical protein
MKNEAIEMIKTPLTVVRVAVFCLPLALVASCGSGSEAVQGTEVVINPQEVGVPVTDTLGNALVQKLYDIELRAPSGYPQIGTQVTIRSEGTVYEVNKNTTPFTFTARATPYLTTINNNSVYTVAVDFPIPAAFSGDITVLEVFSGTAYGVTNVTVTCTDDPADPAICP